MKASEFFWGIRGAVLVCGQGWGFSEQGVYFERRSYMARLPSNGRSLPDMISPIEESLDYIGLGENEEESIEEALWYSGLWFVWMRQVVRESQCVS